MDYVKIGGKVWDAIVTGIEESFTIMYGDNTGRTISQGARMSLDPLGTAFSYKVTFARKKGYEKQYDYLYTFISIPRYDGFPVEIAHNQTTLKFDAYISSGGRKLKRIDTKTGMVYWDAFSLDIVPMSAQVLPV